MPNKRFEKFPSTGQKPAKRGPKTKEASLNVRTASWSLGAGPRQSKDRSGGTPRVKVDAKREGL